MKIFTAIVLTLISAMSFADSWKLRTEKDAITDTTYEEVYVLSKTGDKFSLVKKQDGAFWGYLKLSKFNQFSIDDRLILRVDKNTPVEYDSEFEKTSARLNLGIKSWECNPNIIGFLIWHGKPDEGCGMIKELFDGKVLIIRHHPNQSTTKDITFQISSNKKVISTIAGVDISKCPKKMT